MTCNRPFEDSVTRFLSAVRRDIYCDRERGVRVAEIEARANQLKKGKLYFLKKHAGGGSEIITEDLPAGLQPQENRVGLHCPGVI